MTGVRFERLREFLAPVAAGRVRGSAERGRMKVGGVVVAAWGGSDTLGPLMQRGDDMADWETCPAVESVPGRLSGAWVFRDTRVPVSSLFANLAEGATVDDFLDWFPGVEAWQVKAVLEHEVKHLDSRVEHANPL